MAYKILVVGGAGDMGKIAINKFLTYDTDLEITITDRTSEKLERSKKEHNNSAAVKYLTVDLNDKEAMSELIGKTDLVLNAAGPYFNTIFPILSLCMEKGVNYCDMNDEPDASVEALKMQEKVMSSEIGAFIGLGTSPGLTNIWAKELIEILDETEGVDTFWCTGDEGAIPYGHAVLEHALLIFGGNGEAKTWRNGEITTIPSFSLPEKVSFAPPLGDITLYELSHPEPLTIPHYYPNLNYVRNLGGLHPQPMNGLIRGLGRAIYNNHLTMDEAIDFIQQIVAGKAGSFKCWKYAWAAMREQVSNGEIASKELRRFIWKSLRGKHDDYCGGIVVKASGKKNGKKVTLIRRTANSGPGTIFNSMASGTGTVFAALSRMILDGRVPPSCRKGVYCPEAWVDVKTFYSYMHHYGVSESELMEPIYEES